MRIVLFGATGMVGQGVLRECLRDPAVTAVLAIGRSSTGVQHPALRELKPADFADLSALAPELRGVDACFYCLGVSAAGLSAADYRRITYDYTLAAATLLARLNPAMTFIYVSGQGTDPTGRSRFRWARVKGATESALLALPIRRAVMFRPGFIQALGGIRSKTRLYRVLYAATAPLLPLLRRLLPGQVTTTELVGRAMLAVARHGSPAPVLGTRQINALGAGTGP